MRNFGLIGKKLDHSFSEEYFKFKFLEYGIKDAVYGNFPLESLEALPHLLKEHKLDGFNVTLPYKKDVINYLDDIDPVAAELGAVNTVVVKSGRLKGYNTDCLGFKKSLLNMLENERPKAIVLGNGGSAQAVRFVLRALDMEYRTLARNPQKDEQKWNDKNQDLFRSHHLVINTTPLGMFPDTASCPPIPFDVIGENHYLFDLVYNPPMTTFLALGNRKGARVKNGLEMLELQADAAWEIWNA